METYDSCRIVILEGDRGVCETLTEIIRGWGFNAEGFVQPWEAFGNIRENKCDIILLDVFIGGVCGPDLLMRTGKDLKIIVMTKSNDRKAAISALKRGAFDVLEKPFVDELLRHSILRALTALENERKTKRLIEDIEKSRLQLLFHKERLEKLTGQLLETNRALSIFAQNVEREREDIERRMALKIRELLMPVVARMRGDRNLQACETHLNALTRQIEDLTSGFPIGQSFAMTLSSTETQVAYLVKQGMGTEEIGRRLYISENTVRTHRKNIRKKLGISAQYSLRNFLNSTNGAHRQNKFAQQLYTGADRARQAHRSINKEPGITNAGRCFAALEIPIS
jgi:FixJ family two-component response regulator